MSVTETSSSSSPDETVDEKSDRLKSFQDANLLRNVRHFSAALDIWHMAVQAFQQDRTRLLAVKQHMQNAMLASPADICRWDIVSWFVDVPDIIVHAVSHVQSYCTIEADLQRKYHDAEMLLQDPEHPHAKCPANQPCQPDHQFSAAAKEKVSFGYETTEKMRNGFESYVPVKLGHASNLQAITTQAHIAHLRANSEVRKVRLAQAEVSFRIGFYNKSQPDEA